MDRSAFDGTSQEVFVVAKQSMNDADVLHSQVQLTNSFWEPSKPIIVAILHWEIAINAASFRRANYIKHGLISE